MEQIIYKDVMGNEATITVKQAIENQKELRISQIGYNDYPTDGHALTDWLERHQGASFF
jgi:hypothetical protein